MMKKILLALFICAASLGVANAQTLNANTLVKRVGVTLSPRTGSFVEGTTFDVPILIDTRGSSINGVEIRIQFDKEKFAIVRPSGGVSIIGVWVEPPKYDNTKGTASYVGVIPGGITTSSGLIGTMTFKALKTGSGTISVNSTSKVLFNDGLGSEAVVDLGRAEYSVIPKAPEGVRVYSETHSDQGLWYKNDSPVLSWERDPGMEGFSFELDNNPTTIPDSIADTEDTSTSFEKLKDGLWYFHIKANKKGVWGNTGHFLIRIDTTPPAAFKPQVNYLVAAAVLVERTLISFFTTDNLSGIDRYEVGIIDKKQPITTSPVFVQAESPFQVPLSKDGSLEVIVRAVDKAGNTRDVSVDVKAPFFINQFVKDYLVYILLAIILLGIVVLVTHYMVGHHIIRNIQKFRSMIKKEEQPPQAPPQIPQPPANV
ncbi:MAG: hypothetical protein KBD47_01495 [Candidatus Pacebacteria bacterium]|jgi:hypothetical protein|nr:hypothetical protein [Candidatus Paceibacterota bacterium]